MKMIDQDFIQAKNVETHGLTVETGSSACIKQWDSNPFLWIIICIIVIVSYAVVSLNFKHIDHVI